MPAMPPRRILVPDAYGLLSLCNEGTVPVATLRWRLLPPLNTSRSAAPRATASPRRGHKQAGMIAPRIKALVLGSRRGLAGLSSLRGAAPGWSTVRSRWLLIPAEARQYSRICPLSAADGIAPRITSVFHGKALDGVPHEKWTPS